MRLARPRPLVCVVRVVPRPPDPRTVTVTATVATFVLALHRLRAIIAQQRMDGRPCFTVATLILGIQAFTSLGACPWCSAPWSLRADTSVTATAAVIAAVRGVFGTVDPLGVYHVLPRLWWMVSATFTFPAELACVLLLAYWW